MFIGSLRTLEWRDGSLESKIYEVVVSDRWLKCVA